MPFHVKKVDGGYKVSSPSGYKSKHPMSKEKARAQQAAIYANWDSKEDIVNEMPAWDDKNKDISRQMNTRTISKVLQIEQGRGGEIVNEFEYNGFKFIVFKGKVRKFIDISIFDNDIQIGEFSWSYAEGDMWQTISAAVADKYQGMGLALKAYTFVIDNYLHKLMSDYSLTGESGTKGSFDLWAKLGKIYPFKYTYDLMSTSHDFTPVQEFTRDMMGDADIRFVVSKNELRKNVMESLRKDLRQIFTEGTIKLPTAEIEAWLKAHIDEIIAKLKETNKQKYQTYVDDGINVKNPYNNEQLDITLYINKKLSLPDNETIDPVLYYDAKTTSIHVNADLVLSLYKSKNTLYAGLLKGIIHELTHAIDPGRPHKQNTYGDYEEYLNNEVEFPAFANMYLNKLKNKIQSGKLQVDVLADAIRSGKKIPDIEVGGFMNKLNPENRTKFINYIYKELIA